MNSPFVKIIFGATGDLAQNKLIPALFSLFNQDLLPKDFFIVGFSRREYGDEDFRDHFKELSEKPNWEEFSKHLFYQEEISQMRKSIWN